MAKYTVKPGKTFYDGKRLHKEGAVVEWDGPPSLAFVGIDAEAKAKAAAKGKGKTEAKAKAAAKVEAEV